jgi:uncharacterized protein (DUF302 family)
LLNFFFSDEGALCPLSSDKASAIISVTLDELLAELLPNTPQEPEPASPMKMLLTESTSQSITDAATALRVAVEANGFGVMQVHDLKETMRKKGVEFDHECQIFEICQPDQAKKVLELDMSISSALPCRISLYRKDGMTVLSTIKPTALLAMFDTPQLQQVAQEIEETMIKIMAEAC